MLWKLTIKIYAFNRVFKFVIIVQTVKRTLLEISMKTRESVLPRQLLRQTEEIAASPIETT